jgi:hydrogenase maturation protein HypF
MNAAVTVAARRVRVTGVVQGVGFRPFVHRLAGELGLTGLVGNDSAGVFVEVEGRTAALGEFVARLAADAPPRAIVETVTASPIAVCGRCDFVIVESAVKPGSVTLVSPDVAVCDDCLAEMGDPTDRRYGHPFITCTNCGPRFTIIRGLPYDRANTTMAAFEMCAPCRAEYDDPANRRHHAQPIGCHDCGPRLTLTVAGQPAGAMTPAGAIEATRSMLADGRIMAIKGIGGFHVACDATSHRAVAELRRRKGRADKPLAVMVADLAAAQALAVISDVEARLLLSPARPIVLLRRRPDAVLAQAVAPGNPMIGVMLPYAPVHHLLFATGTLGPLVMTSGNRSAEPITYRDDDVDAALGHIVDGVLGHDRPIHVPCDDSVVRIVDGRLMPIRRSRGYAPLPVRFPAGLRDVLAVGAELKNTFCIASRGYAWVSQHIGDMENIETLNAFERSADQALRLAEVTPAVVAADAHPGYQSSRWALARYGAAVVEVQHHHAHVAAVMAEHQLPPDTDVIGIAFDGTGYGTDGTIWGGEILVANAFGFQRAAHLGYVPLPGGDGAVRHPCRTACAHLWAAGVALDDDLPPVAEMSMVERKLLVRQFETGVGCVPTSSMGRLFDAVGSLLGLRHHISYEAQAAIELEVAAEPYIDNCAPYEFGWTSDIIDCAPVINAIVNDIRSGVATGVIAAGFHYAVASMIVTAATRARDSSNVAALTGGVFQNALLMALARAALEREGFEVLTHRLVPPNDGGLALGQAFVAAHRTEQ